MSVADSDAGLFQFVAHWALIGILLFFAIATIAHLMGVIAQPRAGKIAMLLTCGALTAIAALGLLF